MQPERRREVYRGSPGKGSGTRSAKDYSRQCVRLHLAVLAALICHTVHCGHDGEVDVNHTMVALRQLSRHHWGPNRCEALTSDIGKRRLVAGARSAR